MKRNKRGEAASLRIVSIRWIVTIPLAFRKSHTAAFARRLGTTDFTRFPRTLAVLPSYRRLAGGLTPTGAGVVHAVAKSHTVPLVTVHLVAIFCNGPRTPPFCAADHNRTGSAGIQEDTLSCGSRARLDRSSPAGRTHRLTADSIRSLHLPHSFLRRHPTHGHLPNKGQRLGSALSPALVFVVVRSALTFALPHTRGPSDVPTPVSTKNEDFPAGSSLGPMCTPPRRRHAHRAHPHIFCGARRPGFRPPGWDRGAYEEFHRL